MQDDQFIEDIQVKREITTKSLADAIAPYIGHEPSATASVEAAVPQPAFYDSITPDLVQSGEVALTPEQQQSLNLQMRQAAKDQGFDFIENADGTVTLVPPNTPAVTNGAAPDKAPALPQGAQALLAMTAGLAASGLNLKNVDGLFNPDWLQREFKKASRGPQPTPEQIAERKQTEAEITAHNALIETQRQQKKLMRKATKVMNKERAKQGLRKV